MVPDNMEVLVCNHIMNHLTFNTLRILSNRGIILKKISKLSNLPPYVTLLFVNSHKRAWRGKFKHPSGYIRKPSDNRSVAMNSVDHMVYAQPGIIPQFTGVLAHSIFWIYVVLFCRY